MLESQMLWDKRTWFLQDRPGCVDLLLLRSVLWGCPSYFALPPRCPLSHNSWLRCPGNRLLECVWKGLEKRRHREKWIHSGFMVLQTADRILDWTDFISWGGAHFLVRSWTHLSDFISPGPKTGQGSGAARVSLVSRTVCAWIPSRVACKVTVCQSSSGEPQPPPLSSTSRDHDYAWLRISMMNCCE